MTDLTNLEDKVDRLDSMMLEIMDHLKSKAMDTKVEPEPEDVLIPDNYMSKTEAGRGFERITDALLEDRRIEAIKEHRGLTGYGLKESKDAIERLATIATANPSPYSSRSYPPPMTVALADVDYMLQLLKANKKVAAIKQLRTITNCGLKEAKDSIERFLP